MSVPTGVRSGVRVSLEHKIAVLLSVVFSVYIIVWSLPVMQGGAAKSDVPYPVVILGFAMAVVTIVAAYGVLRGQRWGVVLTIVVNALAFIVGAPGILFGPTGFLVVSSIVGCVANVAVIVLLLKRGRTTAPAPAPARDRGVTA